MMKIMRTERNFLCLFVMIFFFLKFTFNGLKVGWFRWGSIWCWIIYDNLLLVSFVNNLLFDNFSINFFVPLKIICLSKRKDVYIMKSCGYNKLIFHKLKGWNYSSIFQNILYRNILLVKIGNLSLLDLFINSSWNSWLNRFKYLDLCRENISNIQFICLNKSSN